MPEKQSPQIGKLIRGYHELLDHTKDAIEDLAKEAAPRVKTAMEMASDKMSALGEYTREEIDKVSDYLAKDLHDAADYIEAGERGLADWARLDLLVIEDKLLKTFSNMVDETRLELDRIREYANTVGEWHTGEIAGIGALVCTACGEEIHFEKPGHIPPCPKCHATVYKRRD